MVWKVFSKVPAGLMIIPMFIGIIIHTFFPGILEIGSFTTATFSNEGAITIMGVQLLCLGSQLRIKELGLVARRSAALLLSKFLLGYLGILLVGSLAGRDGIFGISLLALVCSITNVNRSIYLSLTAAYGDEADAAVVGPLSLTNGPFLTLLVFGASGAAGFSAVSLIATVMPLLFGILAGNISKTIREFLRPGIQLLLPFIGFTLGAGIDLRNVSSAGIEGILLSIIVLGIGGAFTFLCDKFIARRPGYAGLAASATGANAIGVPAAIALADPAWQPYVESAAAQIAAVVVITAIAVPMITGIFVKKIKTGGQ